MSFWKPNTIPVERRFLSFNGLNKVLRIAKGEDVADVDVATKNLVNDLIAWRTSNMALWVRKIVSNWSAGVQFAHYTQQQFQVLLQVAAGVSSHADTEIRAVTQAIDLILLNNPQNLILLWVRLETLARRGDKIVGIATSQGSLTPNNDDLKFTPWWSD